MLSIFIICTVLVILFLVSWCAFLLNEIVKLEEKILILENKKGIGCPY